METDIMGSIGVIEVPKGPRTLIKGFLVHILQYQRYLGPKTLLFKSLDP